MCSNHDQSAQGKHKITEMGIDFSHAQHKISFGGLEDCSRV